MTDSHSFQSLLIVSFGGPEGPDDVIPFLENVLRGKNVPRARMEEVAEHYFHFGGISPINAQIRDLISALKRAFESRGIELPIYWGNRNWNPTLPEALQAMKDDGVKQALGFFTSAYSSYSGCRQYRENIIDAQAVVGEGAPQVQKLRMFFNHPGFIEASADRVRTELDQIPAERRSDTRIIFTAHSIPQAMADRCQYHPQLNETCRLVAESLGEFRWNLVFQSRSGPPQQPWLEPDICDFLETLPGEGVQDVVLMPVGFLSDHLEVMFDLDEEARETAERIGIRMRRAKTVGVHPRFIEMICQLVEERLGARERLATGSLPPSHDVCPADCCLSGRDSGKRT